ncbi:hypothetical protein D3C72_1376070 [compost metagenome]
MHQRDQTLVAQFFFATVGDGDFGRALQRDFAVVRLERVGGQVFDQAAAFHATDRRAPAEVRERGREAGAERPRGVAPQVFGMIGAIHVLNKVEAFDGGALYRVIGQAAQEARHGQADVTRVFRIAEAAPLGVFHRVEHLGQVARAAQVGKAVQPQQFRRGRRDERRVRGRRHVRHLLDEVHVFGLARDFKVAQQGAERRAAEGAELFFVDLLEHQTLIKVDRSLEVANQITLGGVQHLDLQHRAGVGLLA